VSSGRAPALPLRRRSVVTGGAAWTALALAGCAPRPSAEPAWTGGWVGDIADSGHRWRDGQASAAAAGSPVRRVGVLVVGAGVAGLAAARALREAGVDDLAVLEPHAQPGGNSRAHVLAGQPCPMGAHYLPVPGPAARELLAWLQQLGLARWSHGQLRWDERHLCHAPQERLWADGAWHAGLHPPMEPGSRGAGQARHFARQVDGWMRRQAFAMPSLRTAWTADLAALDGQTFARWLDREGLDDPALRWYLDYACRDDYGAPAAEVSAWAGLHYFCSRHGFQAPGDDAVDEEPVLTWPQGNGWLVEQLAGGLGDRLVTDRMVTRLAVQRDRVAVEAWPVGSGIAERWEARQVVLALPLVMAARLLGTAAPAALREAVAAQRVAPWLVANVQLSREPLERAGPPRAWDNVVFGREALGYVHAQHQQLGQAPADGPVVITAYHALPVGARAALLQQPWTHWARQVVDELALVHPDLPATDRQVDLVRHGHAMSVPAPGVRGSAALAALREPAAAGPRLHFAHADLMGYSVFEEAFTLGDRAGRQAAAALAGGTPRAT
jgi:monoamine oxidase